MIYNDSYQSLEFYTRNGICNKLSVRTQRVGSLACLWLDFHIIAKTLSLTNSSLPLCTTIPSGFIPQSVKSWLIKDKIFLELEINPFKNILSLYTIYPLTREFLYWSIQKAFELASLSIPREVVRLLVEWSDQSYSFDFGQYMVSYSLIDT
jgi:hypothetical protein